MRLMYPATLCLALLAQAAFAQYRPGMVTLGGTASHSGYAWENGTSGTEMVLAPTYGMSFHGGGMAGATVLLRAYEVQIFGGGDARSFAFLPFLRKNMPLSDRLGAFARLSAGIGYTSYPQKAYSWTFQGLGHLGGYLFLLPRFSLEVTPGTLGIVHEDFRYDGRNFTGLTQWEASLIKNLGLSLFYHF